MAQLRDLLVTGVARFVNGAYFGGASTFGSATRPIWWNNGFPQATTYSLSATLNAGSANRLAYYSGANAVSASSHYASATQVGINITNIDTIGSRALYVSGTSEFSDDIYANKSIRNLAVGGGLYWNPYVESATDSSDAASITLIKSGIAGGTELQIKQANDQTDVINLVAPYYIYLNNKRAFTVNDTWLRINDTSTFTSGIYTGTSILRTDNQLQVGNNGANFYAKNTGDAFIQKTLGINGTDTGYTLYVNGKSRFDDLLHFENDTGYTELTIESRRSKNSSNADIETVTGLVTKKTSFIEIRGFAPTSIYRTTGDRPAPYGIGFGDGGDSAGIMPVGANDSLTELMFYGANSGPTVFTWKYQIWESNSYDTSSSNRYSDAMMSLNSKTGDLYVKNTIGINGTNTSYKLYVNNGKAKLGDGTASSSASTGALQVNGGIGASGASWFGNTVTATRFIGPLQGTADNATALQGWLPGHFYNEYFGNRWYHIHMDNTSDSRTGFYKVADIIMTSGYGTYTAAKIVGYLYDHNGNWEQNETHIMPFECIVNITNDSAQLFSNVLANSDHLRIVKIATRTYELQARCNANHTDFDVFFQIVGSNGVTPYETLVAGSSSDTIIGITQMQSHGNYAYRSLILANSRTFTIGNSSKSFNGSANVSWTLSEIGAAAASHHHDGNYITAIRGSSISTATAGYWAAMVNSTQNGSPTCPTSGWWHVLSMDWSGSDVNNWISQLALPTADCGTKNVYFRYNNSNGTSINSGTWRKLWKEGDTVTSAVWNDYAECRQAETNEPGYVLYETGQDDLKKTFERLQHFAGVSSDTWGFSQGETEKAKTPIAVAGRVLVYPYQDRNNYKPGDCVCAAPGGKVDIMTREEIINYPDRIVGTVSCVPDYDTWGGGESADRDPVKVNGRIWIKVR